ncbi:LptF/LptG family permease [Parabacteroides sp. PF5-6]|uniref:LptF/LptG family permease n=1 Tax=Parabacteroides sp. PF5-6 TaxID=1742403 RepID=UPI0024055979|nr:LptF/LptG family permease [Parabacteroides sp. PF5-6]MDF9829400.1 lipopolysaccharide export system permease protein [Parabacteroides sp. PF5-6]
MFQTFLPLFIMTFGICLFIVLMQFIWRFIDDLVGKGLEMTVLAEMFLYAALSLIPMALPLAILLASLMTFGNLGEQLELLAMKSAGVSLIRIMKPLIILMVFVSVGAFFFQNNAMPVVQVKLYSLLYGIRQKSPELDIPEGSFYGEITGYNVYVKSKDKNTGSLKDMMIYDYSNGFNNARVILADSGRLKTSEDKLFLVLTLFNGESFENLNKETSSARRGQTAVPYRRETFGTKEFLIEFDANFTPTDEGFLQNQYIGKNLTDLQTSIDSMTVRLDSMKTVNSKGIYDNSYKRNFVNRDHNPDETPEAVDRFQEILKTAKAEKKETINLHFEEIYNAKTPADKATLLNRAKNSAENVRQDYYIRATTIGGEAAKMRRHQTEWHKKFTISAACLLFFFIGAPLGAIIRKGGLGVPVIISVLLFIFYYIIDNMGYKMARDGVWASWEGMWLSAAVLTPMGVFLTYKAVNDSVILNADTYINALKNLIGKRSNRKVEMKDVIIFAPDYEAVAAKLHLLFDQTQNYITKHTRWINYFTFWKQGGKDDSVNVLSDQVEEIVEELANSDQILILNKLMDYPIMSGYNQLNIRITPKIGMAIAIFFPVGLPIYLLAIYKRKLLLHDVKVVQRTSQELLDMFK